MPSAPDCYPRWVKLPLGMVPSRAVALGVAWGSVIAAAGSALYGLHDPRLLAGLLFLPIATWYWLAVRWVDRHGTWDRST